MCRCDGEECSDRLWFWSGFRLFVPNFILEIGPIRYSQLIFFLSNTLYLCLLNWLSWHHPLGMCPLQPCVVFTDTLLPSVSGLVHLLVLRFLLLVMHQCGMSSSCLQHISTLLRSSKSPSTVSGVLSPISFVRSLRVMTTTPDHTINPTSCTPPRFTTSCPICFCTSIECSVCWDVVPSWAHVFAVYKHSIKPSRLVSSADVGLKYEMHMPTPRRNMLCLVLSNYSDSLLPLAICSWQCNASSTICSALHTKSLEGSFLLYISETCEGVVFTRTLWVLARWPSWFVWWATVPELWTDCHPDVRLQCTECRPREQIVSHLSLCQTQLSM